MPPAHRSPRRWAILLVTCYLIFLADYMQFQLAANAVGLIGRLGISTAQYSTLLTAPMLTAVFGSIPLGALADRYGFKPVVLAANAVALAGALLRGVADSYGMYLAAMLLLGLSPASLNANLIKIFGVWFGEQIGLATGAFYSCGSLGTVAALLTAGLFPTMEASYPATTLALAAGMVAWCVLARSHPRDVEPPPAQNVLRYLGSVARNPAVWLVAAAIGLELASTTAYIGFLPQFYEIDRLMTTSEAGFAAAMFTVGSIAGSLGGPAVAQRLRSNRRVLRVCLACGGVLMALGWALPGWAASTAMLVCGVFATAPGPILEAVPYALPSVGAERAGSAGGLIGMVSMGMAFLLPLAVASVAGNDYPAILAALGVCFAASIIPARRVPDPWE